MNRPYIFCHMCLALDGKITGPFMKAPEFKAPGDVFDNIAFGPDRYYKHQGWISGRATTDYAFTFGAEPDLDENAPLVPEGDYNAGKEGVYYISIDTSGKLGWKENVVRWAGHDAPIIEVLTGKASNAYKDFLRRMEISYIICGEDELDYELVLTKLKEFFGLELVMLGGGGLVNWSFVERGLCDEMSLVVTPVADGSSDKPSLFESRPGYSTNVPVAFELIQVEKIDGDGLWLRYRVKNAK